MTFVEIVFEGTTYKCRLVKDKHGNELIIGGFRLVDALHPRPYGEDPLDGYASKEAIELDDEIFTYVSEDELKLPQRELIELLKESNPDFFD